MEQVLCLSPEHQKPQGQARLSLQDWCNLVWGTTSWSGELATCVLQNILCESSLMKTKAIIMGRSVLIFFLCCCYLLLRCKHCIRQFTNDTSSCKWTLELHIKDHQDICRKDNRDLDKAYIIVSDTWKQVCLWKPDIVTVIFLHFPACYLFSFEGHICISLQTVSLLFHMFYSSWITLICITTFLI